MQILGPDIAKMGKWPPPSLPYLPMSAPSMIFQYPYFFSFFFIELYDDVSLPFPLLYLYFSNRCTNRSKTASTPASDKFYHQKCCWRVLVRTSTAGHEGRV